MHQLGMVFFVIEPEVAGGLGPNSSISRAPDGSLAVAHLHYEFDGWLGDGLLESTPCFIITSRIADEITARCLSGVSFDAAEITTSARFRELRAASSLPLFVWLKVAGEPNGSDFWLAADKRLVVSDRALELLRSAPISHAIVEPFE
ncbi:MAG: hypothetical protein JWQ97_2960 [Phenylobacterium sp.]|nr:hypothetical protein [Phenylobacterium sp.]